MNIYDKFINSEITLIEQAGIKIENRDYTNAELKIVEMNIAEYIMNHSSKNSEIAKLNVKYDRIFRVLDSI